MLPPLSKLTWGCLLTWHAAGQTDRQMWVSREQVKMIRAWLTVVKTWYNVPIPHATVDATVPNAASPLTSPLSSPSIGTWVCSMAQLSPPQRTVGGACCAQPMWGQKCRPGSERWFVLEGTHHRGSGSERWGWCCGYWLANDIFQGIRCPAAQGVFHLGYNGVLPITVEYYCSLGDDAREQKNHKEKEDLKTTTFIVRVHKSNSIQSAPSDRPWGREVAPSRNHI